MDDPVFKQKYQKYKLRVKLWEKDFKKKHGRIPSKYDIREASQEIRDSYKMYYKLKTNFLEDTLNDVLSEDGFDVFEVSQSESLCDGGGAETSLCESVNGGPQLPLDISSIITTEENVADNAQFTNIKELPSVAAIANIVNRDEHHVIRKFEAIEELPLNANAWGSSVSNAPEEKIAKQQAATNLRAHKSNLHLKLFSQSSTFNKRNPRKSLSRNNSASSGAARVVSGSLSEDMETAREVLPDLETILIQKAKEKQASTAAAAATTTIVANQLLADDKSKEAIKTQVDEGWLNRNAMENSIKTTAILRHKSENNVSTGAKRKTNYGLTNLDVSKLKVMQAKTLPTPEKQEIVTSKLIETESQVDLITSSANVSINMPATTKDSRKSGKKGRNCDTDSDSVVDDSGDENAASEYRHIVKRRRVIAEPRGSKERVQATEVTKHDAPEEAVHESDFPADDEKDADYAAETKKKSMRKRAVPKRSKAADSNENIQESNVNNAEDGKQLKPNTKRKTAVANRTKNVTKISPKVSRPSAVKTTKTQRTRKSMAKLNTERSEVGEEEVNEPPQNPEDLRMALRLENGSLTSVPRIKLSDLEQADNLANKYIHSFGHLAATSTAAPTPQTSLINEKREAAKLKLKQKIATGKLNENFVTVNLQKKKFSRGHKTVNYSKHKKKLWRDKKRVAALIGPDMDMGGCDGGKLTCYQCGKTGHMARDCKIQGDKLLPLTAELEEDPTPFMTLEEAAAMASAKSLQAHGGNVNKLPKAVNTAIYTTAVDNEEMQLGSDNENEAAGEHDNDETVDSDDELGNMDIDAAISSQQSHQQTSPIKQYVGHKIPEDFLRMAGLAADDLQTQAKHYSGVGPLYELNADGSVPPVTSEVLDALRLFGHTDFRKGQDRAIMRILCGLSTLVTLSTGSGKSLCYQLPAYLFSQRKKSITLVVSPLVSLMEDQVTGVPHFLRAHCLHTNQTKPQRAKIMQMIADGEVDILLVSPEAIVAGERSTGFGSILRQLPPIAFACIDEAHCVSQWSHNFRPSYLMVCKVLKTNLGVRTVLGLTATATLPTRTSIIHHLGIQDGERGIISDIPLPDNLILSVSKDEQKDKALLQLLLSKRFDGCHSIIIYCTRRDECERIAGFLRTCMQEHRIEPLSEDPSTAKKKKRKRINWHAEPYHAGMDASRRRTIQNAFMNNELRIVVATIAFGMGINKSDIRAVIHYNMPRNFESYVQEVGRAGRDGKISHCHLFLDGRGADQFELRRHIYANSIDRHVIRKLLTRIFLPCSCRQQLSKGQMQPFEGNESVKGKALSHEQDASDFGEIGYERSCQRVCSGHEIGFSIEKTVELLDIPEQNISTLLCYMELDNRWGLNVLSSAYITAKVISYGGPKYLKHAAKDCPPLAMAIAMQIKNKTFKEDANLIEFSVVDVAAAIGWNSGVVKYQLKNLEWKQVNGYPKRSPITVTFADLGFRIKAPGDFTIEEIDEALDTLYDRSVKQEETQLIQLQYVYQGLSSVAYNSYIPCAVENFDIERSEQLKAIIRDYFHNNYPKDLKFEMPVNSHQDDSIINDIHTLINIYPENNFSGRNIARIFHGIQSPNYPAVIWGRCKYWRAHSNSDFNHIVQLANSVIVRRRT